jgi:hypothetical protein
MMATVKWTNLETGEVGSRCPGTPVFIDCCWQEGKMMADGTETLTVHIEFRPFTYA